MNLDTIIPDEPYEGPSLSAEFTSVPLIVKRLRSIDEQIRQQLVLFKAQPDHEPTIGALVELIDLADEIRHEITDGPARMPDDHYDFMVAMVQSGRLSWEPPVDPPDEDGLAYD